LQNGLFHPHDRLGVFYVRAGDSDTERLHAVRLRDAGVHLRQSPKGANHQAGANEQHASESNLDNDQDVARAVAFARLAKRPPTFAQARSQPCAAIFQHRNRTKEQARNQGNDQSEKQHRKIDADVLEARQSRWR
jgi:hypothetical protein